mgnify:CR=1 FL=1
MKNNLQKIFYWFYVVSRGRSVPMSFFNWLVAFCAILKFNSSANLIFGFLALIAIVFAHLGTNLFDDFIDYILKVPKQKCKTQYLENGFTTIKKVFIAAIICFALSLIAGIFFFTKLGLPVLYIAGIAGTIILLYPRLNNYALGEAAVGLCFGLLLFMGLDFVMTASFHREIIFVSIPVSLLTSAVVFCHSIMDYNSDKKNNKQTLCVRLGVNKSNNLLLLLYFAVFFLSLYYIKIGILNISALLSIMILPLSFKLYVNLKKYIEIPDDKKFMPNFILARNISLWYNVIIILGFLWNK